MEIIAYTVDRELGIFCSNGESCREPPYLSFLLKDYGQDVIKCFSNLDFDVANLLALVLDPEEMKTLSKNEKLYIAPYSLTYFPNKFFSISYGFAKGRPYSAFCDISQYDDRLDKVSDEHTPELCFAKANLTKEVAQQVYDSLIKLNCTPKSLISPANVFVESHINKLDLPDVNDVPDGALQLAKKCAKGNWLEAYKRGHFEVFDYDLNSAYSSFAANLLDIRRGKWIQSNEYQPEAVYGYCNAEISLDCKISPILYKVTMNQGENRDELTYTPNNVFETEVTKSKLDLITKYDLGFFTITDGWWWMPDKTKPLFNPLKGTINWLYGKKQTVQGMDRKIDKRVMAGVFYGIFLQLKGNALGEHFLSPYGAEIENSCQCKVFETIMDNHLQDSLCHVAVDGFISTKAIETPNPNGIGEWRLSYQGKSLICGSGLVATEGKFGEGDFSVSYDWLYDQITKDPEAIAYYMSKKTILTLGKAIIENKLADIGKVITVERIVDCLSENKRDYAKSPNSGGDLLKHHYNSQAWSAGMLNLVTGNNKEENTDDK
jgi:hypothetical protein